MAHQPFVPKGAVYKDLDDKRGLESRNGLIQAEFIVFTAQNWSASSRLTPELLLELQRIAVTQIYRCAGFFRDGPVTLQGVEHQPPPHNEVERYVLEMCEYVHQNWKTRLPIHLASYLMWRVNWIHPFYGGNGRTARAVSYLILCASLGFVLPGIPTIPELIVSRRKRYYEALRAADESDKAGRCDVSAMEELMDSLLAEQLVKVHERATGRRGPPPA